MLWRKNAKKTRPPYGRFTDHAKAGATLQETQEMKTKKQNRMGELHSKPSGASIEQNKFPIGMSLLTVDAAGIYNAFTLKQFF